MNKVIIDTRSNLFACQSKNLWISFLIGHQAGLVRRMLTYLRFDVYVCARLIEEIRDVAVRAPKDLYLLALADTIGADYVVSVDADLTDLVQYNQT